MAVVGSKTKIDLKISITLELSPLEAKALSQMIIYGSKPFLDGYYKQLGKSYLQPYEKGIISLFETIKTSLPKELKKVESIIETVRDLEK